MRNEKSKFSFFLSFFLIKSAFNAGDAGEVGEENSSD